MGQLHLHLLLRDRCNGGRGRFVCIVVRTICTYPPSIEDAIALQNYYMRTDSADYFFRFSFSSSSFGASPGRRNIFSSLPFISCLRVTGVVLVASSKSALPIPLEANIESNLGNSGDWLSFRHSSKDSISGRRPSMIGLSFPQCASIHIRSARHAKPDRVLLRFPLAFPRFSVLATDMSQTAVPCGV